MAASSIRAYALRLASILLMEALRGQLQRGGVALELVLAGEAMPSGGRAQLLRELDAISLKLYADGSGQVLAPPAERCKQCGGLMGDRAEHAKRLREGLALAEEFKAQREARGGLNTHADAYGSATYYAKQTLGWLEGFCDPCTLGERTPASSERAA